MLNSLTIFKPALPETHWLVSRDPRVNQCIKHGGDHYLGLQLNDDGRFRVLYDGPAAPVMRYLKAPKADGHKGRASAGQKLEPLTLETWAVLNLDVEKKERLVRRKPINSAQS
jgi:hypothetical protein